MSSEPSSEQRRTPEEVLWQFSVTLWQDEPLQADLLTLQDTFGAHVNALLFAVWLAVQNRGFDSYSLAHCGFTVWHETMTAPLRALRKQAKTKCDELYQHLKSAELIAERHEQKLLVSTLDAHVAPISAISQEALMWANLASYLQTLKVDANVALPRCKALIKWALTHSLGD